jgi:signal transduction histidine kinase
VNTPSRNDAPHKGSPTRARRQRHRDQIVDLARERIADAERLAQHPLDPIPTVKIKIGFVIFAAVSVTVFVFWVGTKLGVWPSVSGVVAMLFALLIVRFLARGLTTPLRQIAAATEAMAAGDYSKRVTVTSRDEIAALATSFNRMAAQLAETDRVRRDLVANVSHELRTPITALQAKLENIVDGIEPPNVDTFRIMLEQVERLGRLVHQLLDLSRLESGTVPLERRATHANALITRAAREAELRGAPVTMSCETIPADLTIDVDPERMAQVLANLLENAINASPAGGTIHVLARGVNNDVVLSVEDEGPGIPPEQAERIFERFYRVDSARSRQLGGAGLGLAISQWIVDLHGGSIHPEPRQPHGCRMLVNIPNVRLASSGQPPASIDSVDRPSVSQEA